jgi:WXG100 family type VII secretion target
MADKTEVDYEKMQSIAKRFQAEADALNQMLSQTKGKVDGLHGSGWIGRGSDQFFNETQQLVLPSLARLVQALQKASTEVDAIVREYRNAEEEGQGVFKSFGD